MVRFHAHKAGCAALLNNAQHSGFDVQQSGLLFVQASEQTRIHFDEEKFKRFKTKTGLVVTSAELLPSDMQRTQKAVKLHQTHIDLHLPVQSIVEEKVVGHADPVGFHGMPLAVVIVSHIACVRTHRNFILKIFTS